MRRLLAAIGLVLMPTGGDALRPTAADPPKRSMSAWWKSASFARASPHNASFTARRGNMTTGNRWGGHASPHKGTWPNVGAHRRTAARVSAGGGWHETRTRAGPP
jgi:hypothetical protein